jgi:hypothetical protein
MKRFIILLVALLAAVSAGAQTQARRFNGYVGGGFSADFASDYSYITLEPDIAWPVGNHLFLGSRIIGGWARSGSTSQWLVGVSPYARLHAGIFAGFRVFADAEMDYRRRMYSGQQGAITDLDFGVRPGIMIPLGGSAYAMIQIGFLGYESRRAGDLVTHHTGFRCNGSDIRIGGSFRL